MLYKSFSISVLVLAINVMLVGCGGSSGGGGKASGEKYSTGAFNVQVPKGWAVTPFYRSGQISPNTIAVHKGTAEEYKLMVAPFLQIQLHTESGFSGEQNAKNSFQELKEMQSVTLGKNLWKGFSAVQTRSGNKTPVNYIWTAVDGGHISIAVWTEMGDKKISLDEADVKALIASITPE